LAATLPPIGSGGRVSYTWPHPRTTRPIEKRLPPPTPQEQAESDQDGHPGKVKAKGGGRRAEERMGACPFE